MLHEYHKGGTYSKRESKDSNELGHTEFFATEMFL